MKTEEQIKTRLQRMIELMHEWENDKEHIVIGNVAALLWATGAGEWVECHGVAAEHWVDGRLRRRKAFNAARKI